MDGVVIGLAAGALTSTAFVPQIWRGLRTKKLTDVSPHMLGAMLAGLSLWLVYGLIERDLPIIAANTLGVVQAGTLLAMWARWGRAPRKALSAAPAAAVDAAAERPARG